MKTSSFEFHVPTSLPEALEMLSALDDARPIAGGQSLVPLLALRLAKCAHLVDLNRLRDLDGVDEAGGWVRIGSMTRQCRFTDDSTVGGRAPLFAAATPHVGHFQVRNRGTVGGSIVHADPAAEYPAVVLALDAEMGLARLDGERWVRADSFFEFTWTTAIEPDELIVGVRFRQWSAQSGFAVSEIARRHGDFALAGAAVGVSVDECGAITRAAVALFGVGPVPVRAGESESALIGVVDGVGVDEASRLACSGLTLTSDVHADADYRRRVIPVVVRRAVGTALDRARAVGEPRDMETVA